MTLTPHHARYFAHDLTRRSGAGMDRLSTSSFDAAVDPNPHQIEAALFALKSPLSKGVILADEAGLGETMEAGIVLCQSCCSSKDSEFDLIYVNGTNNLENLKTPDDRWKVRLIEEDFYRLMFEAGGS